MRGCRSYFLFRPGGATDDELFFKAGNNFKRSRIGSIEKLDEFLGKQHKLLTLLLPIMESMIQTAVRKVTLYPFKIKVGGGIDKVVGGNASAYIKAVRLGGKEFLAPPLIAKDESMVISMYQQTTIIFEMTGDTDIEVDNLAGDLSRKFPPFIHTQGARGISTLIFNDHRGSFAVQPLHAVRSDEMILTSLWMLPACITKEGPNNRYSDMFETNHNNLDEATNYMTKALNCIRANLISGNGDNLENYKELTPGRNFVIVPGRRLPKDILAHQHSTGTLVDIRNLYYVGFPSKAALEKASQQIHSHNAINRTTLLHHQDTGERHCVGSPLLFIKTKENGQLSQELPGMFLAVPEFLQMAKNRIVDADGGDYALSRGGLKGGSEIYTINEDVDGQKLRMSTRTLTSNSINTRKKTGQEYMKIEPIYVLQILRSSLKAKRTNLPTQYAMDVTNDYQRQRAEEVLGYFKIESKIAKSPIKEFFEPQKIEFKSSESIKEDLKRVLKEISEDNDDDTERVYIKRAED